MNLFFGKKSSKKEKKEKKNYEEMSQNWGNRTVSRKKKILMFKPHLSRFKPYLAHSTLLH